MSKVKSLKKQNKDTYIVALEIDDSVKEYTVSIDLVVEYRLIQDKELNKETLSSFQKAASLDKIYQLAQKYTIKYAKSVHEMKAYLEKKQLVEEDISWMIQKLKAMHLLDDQRALESAMIHHLEDLKNGPEKIEFELKKRGFPYPMIMDAISQIPMQKYKEHCDLLFEKRKHQYKKNSIIMAKRKMLGYLLQKGYPKFLAEEVIQAHQKEFFDITLEKETLKREFEKQLKKYQKTDINVFEKKQKIIYSLRSKGFLYEDIIEFIERSSL